MVGRLGCVSDRYLLGDVIVIHSAGPNSLNEHGRPEAPDDTRAVR